MGFVQCESWAGCDTDMCVVEQLLPFFPGMQLLQLIGANQKGNTNLRSQFVSDSMQSVDGIGNGMTLDFLLIYVNWNRQPMKRLFDHFHAMSGRCLQAIFLPRITGRNNTQLIWTQ